MAKIKTRDQLLAENDAAGARLAEIAAKDGIDSQAFKIALAERTKLHQRIAELDGSTP